MDGKQSNKDRIKQITDGIEQGIKELFESERYRSYLATMGRFHTYSVNNTLLIHAQCPQATLVAGFSRWKNQFGRHVKKGEKGIHILAPAPFLKKIEEIKRDPVTQEAVLDENGEEVREEKTVKISAFKVVSVFDVSQTEGKPLPMLAMNLTGNVEHYDILLEALRQTSAVPIQFQNLDEEVDGYFSLDSQSITIREGMSQMQTISAIVHEMAHSRLHNRSPTSEENAKNEAQKTRNTEEVEAESVSYAVCQYFGIETGENSFGYIASWSKNKELKELRESLETIHRTSSELIEETERHYSELMKARETALQSKEQALAGEEALYLVDDAVYLHVQPTDDGWDYSLYDRETKKLLDGGVIEAASVEASSSTPIRTICAEIFAVQGIMAPVRVASVNIDILEELERAQAGKSEPGAHDISGFDGAPAQTLSAFGYTAPGMLPVSADFALELMERDVPIYLLGPDNTAWMAFDREDITNHSGMFGITTEDWKSVQNSPDILAIQGRSPVFYRKEADSTKKPGESTLAAKLKSYPPQPRRGRKKHKEQER